MSDLLSQASLVMIPSGYAEDKVYSVVPSDGSGDLSFTRASNGTRINSAGLVEVCPWNLLQQSETFDNATWIKSNSNITANNTTAPNGTATADQIAANGTLTSSYFAVGQSIANNITGQPYTATLYAKAGTLTQMLMYLGASNGIYWNLSNGQFISYYSGVQNIIAYNSEAVGDGWYKYTISLNASSTTISFESYAAKSGDLYANYTTADNYYLWGAQLNIGSTAKPYFPTTDRLNVPRLTYQNGGGGCPSLLLEKQSTNLQLYSEDFRNVAEGGATNTWTPNDTLILSTNNTAPDGTLSATRIRGNGSNRARQAVIFGTSGAPYSGSIFIRRVSGTANIELRVGDVSQVSTINPTSDWQRFTYTASPTSTAIRLAVVFSNNTDEFEIWGAQLEASSYPTSYIPTTSSSATRVADACFKTGISSLIGQTEGVLFYDGFYGDNPNEVYMFLEQSIAVGTLNAIFVQQFSNTIRFTVNTSTQQAQIISSSYNIGQRIKIAAAYKSNDFVMYINGVQIGTDTSGSVPTCTHLQIGTYPTDPTNPIFIANKGVNQAALFKTRLTNAELASITSL